MKKIISFSVLALTLLGANVVGHADTNQSINQSINQSSSGLVSSSLSSAQPADTKNSSTTSSQKSTTQVPSSSSQNQSTPQSTPSTSTTALKDASTLVVKNVKINVGDSFSNAQAFVSATDQNGAALALSHLHVSGTVDPTKAGSYTLTFTNEKLAKTALVTVSDPTAVPDVEYSTQIQNIGWDSVSKNGALSGTSGKSLRMEAIKINLSHLPDGLTGGISYSTYVQNIGWQSEVSDGAISGTVGKSLRVEAIKIRLTGTLASTYSIYYRTYAQNIGWMNWTSDGAISGTSGMSLRVEALEIQLVKKGNKAPASPDSSTFSNLFLPTIAYQSHIQNIGWQSEVKNGAISGTVGKALRLEALRVSVANLPTGVSGGITYQAHVQNIGWQSPVQNGQLAGTEGKSLRVEALNIKLTGDLNKYFDVWYQSQVQGYGWLGWTADGKNSGTTALGLRMESVKIVLVPKGQAAPGSTKTSFIAKPSGWESVNGTLKYYDAGSKKYTKQFSLVYYSQLDPRWSGKYYGGYTFRESGCGQASIAMIISGFGTSVTPPNVANYTYSKGLFNDGSAGSDESSLTTAAKKWGLSYKVMGSSSQLASYLQKGYPATVCINLGYGERHIVALTGYSNGYTTVHDPWNNLLFSGKHTVSEVWSRLSWLQVNKDMGASAAVVYYK